MVEFEFLIHSNLNTISGVILVIIGLLALFRNRAARSNQFLALFFLSLALYEFFDGFTVAFRRDPSLAFLNGLRDVALTGLVLSLGFALLTILILKFSTYKLLKIERFIIWVGVLVLAIAGAIIGDNIAGSLTPMGFYNVVMINRDIIGFLSITGTITVLSALILLILFLLIREVQDQSSRNKLLRLFLGFLVIIAMIFILDLRLIFPEARMFIAINDWFHILLHGILFAGEVLILSTFWVPFAQKKSASEQHASIS